MDIATPDKTLLEWEIQAEASLPQSSRERRRELIRIVREGLLDYQDKHISESAFLHLFHDGGVHRKRTLLWGRLLMGHLLVQAAIQTLILPALALSDTALAPLDADLISPEAWNDLLKQHLRSGIPEEAYRKTRSTLLAALARLGILRITGNTTRTTRAQHAEPDPLAFAWLIAQELSKAIANEVPETWAYNESVTSRLFCPHRNYAEDCVEAGVQHGLLVRTYLAGSPRLRAGKR